MNEIDIVRAIKHLKPTAEFSFENCDYSTIRWDILEGDAPTWAEIQAAHEIVKAEMTKAEADKKAQRAALLERLGLTEDEMAALLG